MIINDKMKEQILIFLKNINVDTRYISLWDQYLFINNIRFSHFSRKKEELFNSKFPDQKVIRSKVFQKMCIRASHVLNKALTPKETIFIKKEYDECPNLALNIILEPYTRKYGIKIITSTNINEAQKYGADKLASPLTLNQEVEKIINQMFQGKKIALISSNVNYENKKVIYPLINVPQSWIKAWVEKSDLKCTMPNYQGSSADLVRFLEEYIPNVQENLLKSARFLSND